MTAPSLRVLEQRLRAVEARLSEIEGGYGDTLYRLRRESVKNDLRLGRLLNHLHVPDVTDDGGLGPDQPWCGYPDAVGGTNVSLITRGLIQRSRL